LKNRRTQKDCASSEENVTSKGTLMVNETCYHYAQGCGCNDGQERVNDASVVVTRNHHF
jgi:hypothetical protein